MPNKLLVTSCNLVVGVGQHNKYHLNGSVTTLTLLQQDQQTDCNGVATKRKKEMYKHQVK